MYMSGVPLRDGPARDRGRARRQQHQVTYTMYRRILSRNTYIVYYITLPLSLSLYLYIYISCIYIYIYLCIYTYLYTYTQCIYIYIYNALYAYAYIYIYIYVYIYTNMYVIRVATNAANSFVSFGEETYDKTHKYDQ